jgi:hypothetical protein
MAFLSRKWPQHDCFTSNTGHRMQPRLHKTRPVQLTPDHRFLFKTFIVTYPSDETHPRFMNFIMSEANCLSEHGLELRKQLMCPTYEHNLL